VSGGAVVAVDSFKPSRYTLDQSHEGLQTLLFRKWRQGLKETLGETTRGTQGWGCKKESLTLREQVFGAGMRARETLYLRHQGFCPGPRGMGKCVCS
jgi:hypothetical protein